MKTLENQGKHIIFQSTLSMRRATGSNLKGYLRTSEFQSTLSMRRATCSFSSFISIPFNFNPRSP